jgi:hypothetical protein
MTAPINTGDFWIRQKISEPYGDPGYTYPESAIAMSPKPIAIFRLDDFTGGDSIAYNLLDNADAQYKGSSTSLVNGLTQRCDCSPGINTGDITDLCNVLVSSSKFLLYQAVRFSFVIYVTLKDLSERNTLLHYGDYGNPSLWFSIRTDGNFQADWYGGTKIFTGYTETIDQEHVYGLTVDYDTISFYVDGTLVETDTMSPVMTIHSSEETISIGNYHFNEAPANGTDFRSAANFYEWLLWDKAIDGDAHKFVADEILKPCAQEPLCEYGFPIDETTWAAAMAAQGSGEIQVGDFWIHDLEDA